MPGPLWAIHVFIGVKLIDGLLHAFFDLFKRQPITVVKECITELAIKIALSQPDKKRRLAPEWPFTLQCHEHRSHEQLIFGCVFEVFLADYLIGYSSSSVPPLPLTSMIHEFSPTFFG